VDISFDSEFIINSAKVENSKNVLKSEDNHKSAYELKKAAQDFEAIFINMLIQSMWKTIPESGLFEKDSATNIYEGIIQSALSEEIARSGGLGMTEMFSDRLTRDKR
jgi:Rod binding domain-containing protein